MRSSSSSQSNSQLHPSPSASTTPANGPPVAPMSRSAAGRLELPARYSGDVESGAQSYSSRQSSVSPRGKEGSEGRLGSVPSVLFALVVREPRSAAAVFDQNHDQVTAMLSLPPWPTITDCDAQLFSAHSPPVAAWPELPRP